MRRHPFSKVIVIGTLSASVWAGPCRAEDALPCNEWCRAFLDTRVDTTSPSQVVTVDATGAKTKAVDYFYALKDDCSSSGEVQIGVVQPPLEGTLLQDEARERVFFPTGSARAACNTRRAPAVRLFYERGPAFSGTDMFVVRIAYPDGAAETMTYEITARR